MHQSLPLLVPGVMARVDPASLERVPETATLLIQRTQHLSESTPWVVVTEPEDISGQLLLSEQAARHLAAALHQQSQG